ncbi:LytTR family transcriptional regulator [Spirosoma sp. KCTC 42546]|uniref:LytTR family DNA-binding domain-containing protein n=1 Tax=Spirosoma sp. KCTC 42546 TaxID=2520506 RepID=UPI001157698A|nr:LytTR family DNA-binding domain-containing protein [Spirosoma sp. KCTC 42546]QDK79575.1 LytTR family transcriptional regulator [Spirosoma sp. KCTC 42546]
MKKALPPKQLINHIEPQSVLYLTGDANYSRIHLMNGTVFLSAYTLKWFAQKWPEFLRPHKQALVNPAYIHRLQVAASLRSQSYVVMQDQVQLPISRRRVPVMLFQLGRA